MLVTLIADNWYTSYWKSVNNIQLQNVVLSVTQHRLCHHCSSRNYNIVFSFFPYKNHAYPRAQPKKTQIFRRRIFWHLRKLIAEWENENQTSGFWIIQNKIRIYTDLNGHYYDTILFFMILYGITYTLLIIRIIYTVLHPYHTDHIILLTFFKGF